MAHTEVVGHDSCPLHKAKTEIRRIESFLFDDDHQTEDVEVCLDCGFTQEIGFFSTNATTAFNHSISKGLFQKKAKKEAASAVIATNAQISPKQFQDLRKALGQEVEMQFHYHKTYSDEEPSTDEKITERFVLEDAHFVRDPLTAQTYLAFLKSTEGNTNFPYWKSENVFGDFTEVQINSLRLKSGEELWHFGLPGKGVATRWNSDNIIQAIKDHSESMLALVVNQTI